MWEFADRLIDGFVDEGHVRDGGRLRRALHPHRDRRPRGRARVRPLASSGSGCRPCHQEVGAQAARVPLRALRRATSRTAAQNPGKDVLSGLATATFPDGSTPEVKDAALIAANLFAGGQETTVRLLSFALRMLGERPDLQAARPRRPRPDPEFHRGDAAAREPAAHAVPDGPRPDRARRRGDPRRRLAHARAGRLQPRPPGVREPLRVRHRPPQRPPAHRVRPRHPHLRRRAARPRRGPGHVNRFLDRTSDITISEKHHGPAGARPTSTSRPSSSGASKASISTSRRSTEPIRSDRTRQGAGFVSRSACAVDMMSFVCGVGRPRRRPAVDRQARSP